MKTLRLYGAGLLVALLLTLAACGTSGGGGGATWTPRASWTTNSLSGVAYVNGLFVAVGDRGTILTSPDGVNWTRQTPPTGN